MTIFKQLKVHLTFFHCSTETSAFFPPVLQTRLYYIGRSLDDLYHKVYFRNERTHDDGNAVLKLGCSIHIYYCHCSIELFILNYCHHSCTYHALPRDWKHLCFRLLFLTTGVGSFNRSQFGDGWKQGKSPVRPAFCSYSGHSKTWLMISASIIENVLYLNFSS